MSSTPNDIDWRSLNHAYGSAEDVPGQLNDLESGAHQVRDEALHKLWGNIWHQGTVYEATQFAVPRLATLFLLEGHPKQTEIGLLIASIANGIPKVTHVGPEAGNPSSDAVEYARAANRAVVAEVPRILRELNSPAPMVRATTALICAATPLAKETTVPALSTRLELEVHPRVRLALGLALASLGKLCSSAFSVEPDVSPFPEDLLWRLAQKVAAAPERRREAAIPVLEDLSSTTVDWSLVEHILGDEAFVD